MHSYLLSLSTETLFSVVNTYRSSACMPDSFPLCMHTSTFQSCIWPVLQSWEQPGVFPCPCQSMLEWSISPAWTSALGTKTKYRVGKWTMKWTEMSSQRCPDRIRSHVTSSELKKKLLLWGQSNTETGCGVSIYGDIINQLDMVWLSCLTRWSPELLSNLNHSVIAAPQKTHTLLQSWGFYSDKSSNKVKKKISLAYCPAVCVRCARFISMNVLFWALFLIIAEDKYQLILIQLIKNKMQTPKKAELLQVEK